MLPQKLSVGFLNNRISTLSIALVMDRYRYRYSFTDLNLDVRILIQGYCAVIISVSLF